MHYLLNLLKLQQIFKDTMYSVGSLQEGMRTEELGESMTQQRARNKCVGSRVGEMGGLQLERRSRVRRREEGGMAMLVSFAWSRGESEGKESHFLSQHVTYCDCEQRARDFHT